MKKLLLVLLFAPLISYGQEITTYYLIRHAEKNITDLTNKNPHLTEEGRERETRWTSVFKNIEFDMVSPTTLHRTLDTHSPLIVARGRAISNYSTDQVSNDASKKLNAGQSV